MSFYSASLLLFTFILLHLFPGTSLAQEKWSSESPFTQPIPPPIEAPSLNSPVGNDAASEVNATPAPNPIVVQEKASAAIGDEAPSVPTTPEELGESLQKTSQQKLSDAKNTLLAAIQGNRNAQISLASDFVLPVAMFIIVLLAANWIGNRLGAMVSTVVTNRVDVTLGRFSGKLVKSAVIIIALMAALGPKAAGLAGVIAAVGFAIGMALQGTLGNFAAGIALLVFRPFKVGDFIVVDDEKGTVDSIELFTTAINTPDNRYIIIPNDRVFGNKIENWSHNAERRIDVTVGVSYDASTERTRQVLIKAIEDIDGALRSPEPQVCLSQLGASSVDWNCRVWARPADVLAVKERVTESIKLHLDRNRIAIPYPQLDLHVVANPQQKAAA